MNFEIRRAHEDEWKRAMRLAWDTFLKYDAPDYCEEGIQNFKDFVEDETLERMFLNGQYILFVALVGDEIVGVISLRSGNHISLLFVADKYQRQGIGRELVLRLKEYMFTQAGQMVLTVNASPYAEAFYHRIGFIDRGLQTTLDGITFTPMEIYI